MLKVFALILGYWRFLLLFLDVEGLWFLVFCLFAFFFKNSVKIYSILFRIRLYKFSLTYNDEKFMKGDFLMIIVLHMSCFVFECLWWLLLFFCYRAEFSLCFNPSISKLCIQGKIFNKSILNCNSLYLIVNIIFDYICNCTNYSLACINVLHMLHFNDK